jgi:hypothetical protein
MFALLCVWMCVYAVERPAWIAAALLAAFLAAFSAGSGLLVWPVGLVVLLALCDHRQRLRNFLVWSGGAIACGVVCFYGYVPHPVPWPSGVIFVLSNPLAAAQYAAIFMGSSLGAGPFQAMAFGLLSAAILLLALWDIRRDHGLWIAFLPFPATVLLSALALMPLTMGRLELGVTQPFWATRYVPVAALWPIGAYMAMLARSGHPEWRQSFRLFTAILCIGVGIGYAEGFFSARKAYARQKPCQAVLAHYKSRTDDEIQCYYPDPNLARSRAFWLEHLHLSVFRDQK